MCLLKIGLQEENTVRIYKLYSRPVRSLWHLCYWKKITIQNVAYSSFQLCKNTGIKEYPILWLLNDFLKEVSFILEYEWATLKNSQERCKRTFYVDIFHLAFFLFMFGFGVGTGWKKILISSLFLFFKAMEPKFCHFTLWRYICMCSIL